MFEINVIISCPDLMRAATLLASAMGGSKIETPAGAIPAPFVSNTPNTAAVNPTIGGPSTTSPGSVPSNTAPVAGVPLAPAPAFSLEQVSKAGADLVTAQPGRMPELMGLLQQFGVQTVNALKPEQLGAFATALRGMGAQI